MKHLCKTLSTEHDANMQKAYFNQQSAEQQFTSQNTQHPLLLKVMLRQILKTF